MSDGRTIGADPCSYRPGTDQDWSAAELDIGQQSFLVNPLPDGDAVWVTFADVVRIDEVDRDADLVELEVALADHRLIGLRVTPEIVDRMLGSLVAAAAAAPQEERSPAPPDPPTATAPPNAAGGPPPLPPMGTPPTAVSPAGAAAPPPDAPPPPTGPTPPPPPHPPHPPQPPTATSPASPPTAAETSPEVAAEPASAEDAATDEELGATAVDGGAAGGDPPDPDSPGDDHVRGTFTISPLPGAAPAPPPPPREPAPEESGNRRPVLIAALAALAAVALVTVGLVVLLGGDGDDTAASDGPAGTTTRPPTTTSTPPTSTPPDAAADGASDEFAVTVTDVHTGEQDGDVAIYVDLTLRNEGAEEVSSFQTVVDISADGGTSMASFPMTCDAPLPAGTERSGAYSGDVEADATSFADCTVAGWAIDPDDPAHVAVAEALSSGAAVEAAARIIDARGPDGSTLGP